MTSTNEWDARDETIRASRNASIPLPRRDDTKHTLVRIERKKLLLPHSASHPPRVQLLVAGGVVEPKVREYTGDSPRLRIRNVADEPDACLEKNRPCSEVHHRKACQKMSRENKFGCQGQSTFTSMTATEGMNRRRVGETSREMKRPCSINHLMD